MSKKRGNQKTVNDSQQGSQTASIVNNPGISAIQLILDGIDKKTKAPSFQQRVNDTVMKVESIAKDSKVVGDRYGNTVTSTGNQDKIKAFSEYGFSNDTLNYSLWTALYNDSWVFKRAIDKPSQDIVKLGVLINMKNVDKKPFVEAQIRKQKTKLSYLFKMGHLYGGSIAVMMFDGLTDDDYAKGMESSINKIRKSKVMRLYITDRWYGLACDYNDTVSDMENIDYGKPKSYTVTFANGSSLKVHHDFILRYEHRDAPPLIKNGQLQGWGYAEGAHILDELMKDDQLKSAIMSLINKSLIEVIKMDGMRGLFQGADEESQNQIRQRLEMVNWARSFNSLTFLDSQDEYQMNSFSGLGGLSDLLEKNMWSISAALEMQGVLFGDLTQGFSHDSEALERYDDTIQTRADDLARPVYEKLILTLFKWANIDEAVNFEFGSLLTDVKNAKKNEALDKHIDRLDKLMERSAIGMDQYLKSIKKFQDTGEVDFFITEESIEQAKVREQQESEIPEEGDEQ